MVLKVFYPETNVKSNPHRKPNKFSKKCLTKVIYSIFCYIHIYGLIWSSLTLSKITFNKYFLIE